MKKLYVSVIFVFSILSSSSVLAANKIGMAFDQGFGVTGQFNNINAFIGNDGLSGDYIFREGTFAEDIPFHWYVGGGAYYNWDNNDHIGARVPLGLTLPFAKNWDVYGQAAPALEYDLRDSGFKFKMDFALGIRYAF